MRKLKIMGVLVLFSFFTTGCMKMDLSMDIRKDKSMDFVIIQAVDQELLSQQGGEVDASSMMQDSDMEELKKQGYKVEKYSEKSMVGYKISRTIDNIDTVSTEKDITSNVGLSNTSSEIFTVKKGFFKNTYKAKIVSEDSNKITEQIDSATGDDMDTDINTDTEMDTDSTDLSDIDYSSMLQGMDMKFSVHVPYKALSQNATEVKDDGKMLVWDLLKLDDSSMMFEFELYNSTNISIVAGIIDAILIVLIILLLLRAKKIHSKKQSNSVSM